jgi:hypothetical protein
MALGRVVYIQTRSTHAQIHANKVLESYVRATVRFIATY